MYATIRRYRSSEPEEVRRLVEASFLPLLRAQPGFVSYSLVHAGNGAMMSVTVFETRAGAEESDRMAAEWVARNVAPLVQGRPDITHGEVVAHAP
jgi:prophage antirepressor-like protein